MLEEGARAHRGKGRNHPAMCVLSLLNISFAVHLACVSTAKRESIVSQAASERAAIRTKSAADQEPPVLGP